MIPRALFNVVNLYFLELMYCTSNAVRLILKIKFRTHSFVKSTKFFINSISYISTHFFASCRMQRRVMMNQSQCMSILRICLSRHKIAFHLHHYPMCSRKIHHRRMQNVDGADHRTQLPKCTVRKV